MAITSVSSPELFKINPWTWLRDTLTKLPTTPADQLATLLPTTAK